MLRIDGSLGEGGGQILRSSLALSVCLGKPFHIVNIRKARRNPGLQPQHLAAVQAAATVGEASVEGAEIGSAELVFRPTGIRSGAFHFDVGTAGSTTLVLQTVLPALLTAWGTSRLVLEGGTHNPFAPPFDFLEKAFLPLVSRMGPKVIAQLDRPGFYPAGGGKVRVEITPVEHLHPLELLHRGAVNAMHVRAILSHLPEHIALRELNVFGREMNLSGDQLEVDHEDKAQGPGNAVVAIVTSEHIQEVFTAFGERGVRAEAIAGSVARQVRRYLAAGAPVGKHLADQLLLLIALGGGRYETARPSLHTMTNTSVVRLFLNVVVECEKVAPGRWRISVT